MITENGFLEAIPDNRDKLLKELEKPTLQQQFVQCDQLMRPVILEAAEELEREEE